MRNSTQSSVFCSCLLGFRPCSVLRAFLMTMLVPFHSFAANQMRGISCMNIVVIKLMASTIVLLIFRMEILYFKVQRAPKATKKTTKIQD